MLEYKFIETSKGKIHAVVGGEGEALILIHGFGDVNSWKTWMKNVDALSMVARVYALELLGYGESDHLAESLDAGRHAEIILEILDTEKISRASFAGLSWGGQVAQELAIRYPERVEKIILIDSLFDSSEAGLAHLARIQAPTFIVWDEEDAVIPSAWAHILAMAIRDSRLVIFTREQRDPDANPQNKHWTQMTHSLWFNKTVTEFLES